MRANAGSHAPDMTSHDIHDTRNCTKPRRARRWGRRALLALGMSDTDYGWTVEMQVKAVQRGLRIAEVPVRYHRRRGGESKISQTVRGSIGAGAKILYTIFRHSTHR